MAIYKGFSTANESASVTLLDTDLIKQDIINAFNTRLGERVMRGDFGCGVWDYIHSPLDSVTKDAVTAEVKRIISLEPRVAMTGMDLQEFEHGLQILIELNYVNLESSEVLFLQFDARNNSLSSSIVNQ